MFIKSIIHSSILALVVLTQYSAHQYSSILAPVQKNNQLI